MPPVSALFDCVGQQLDGSAGRFFQGTAVQMEAVTGRPPQTAMKMQLELEPLLLGQEETKLLLELGGSLGRYDLEGQARTMELYKNRLDGMIAETEEVLRQKTKAWTTASVCAGLALVVILL